MALSKDGYYINFKKVLKERKPKFSYDYSINEGGFEISTPVLDNDGNHISIDTLFLTINVNVYENISKEYSQNVKVYIDIPYQESISDENIYNLLKQEIITIKDSFSRDIEIDLTDSENN